MTDDYATLAVKKEHEKFRESIGGETDPVMLILRAHLYSENLLERLIGVKLPRGDKVIDNGNLTYNQKLILVEAFDCLEDAIISSLKNLNKLRNQCAHELQKKITEVDVTKIGSSLGKEFTRFKREAKFDQATLLRSVIDYICGYLTSTCLFSEHPDLTMPDSIKLECNSEM